MTRGDWLLGGLLIGAGILCMSLSGAAWTVLFDARPSPGVPGWLLISLVAGCLLALVLGGVVIAGWARTARSERRCDACGQPGRQGWNYCPHCGRHFGPRRYRRVG